MKIMTTLYADEGKVITNGTDYGTTISLAEGVTASDYKEITVEEYNEILDKSKNVNNTI